MVLYSGYSKAEAWEQSEGFNTSDSRGGFFGLLVISLIKGYSEAAS